MAARAPADPRAGRGRRSRRVRPGDQRHLAALADHLGPVRLTVITVGSVAATCVTIVIATGLWEQAAPGRARAGHLFNINATHGRHRRGRALPRTLRRDSDQSKKFVYIVDKDNKVVYREVELGKEVEAQRIVLKGLEPGERVIVNGIQHIAPGDVVKAKEWISNGG